MRRAPMLALSLVAASIGCGDDGSAADVAAGGGPTSTGAVGGSGGQSGGAGGQGAAGGSGGRGGAGPAVVDTTTIENKLLMGYQGWFACPADGAPTDRWVHWFGAQVPEAQ